MSISINDIISTDLFKEYGQLVAGHNGLNRLFQSITVMEVIDFAKENIDENLFILTTFSNSAHDPNLMKDIFIELIDKKISGLAIKINRYLKTLPNALYELADHYDIPLIILSENVLFSKVILSVSSLIINSQYETIRIINEQYELMNSLILREKKLDYFIKHIGEFLNINCYCYTFEENSITKHLTNNNSEDTEFMQVVSSLKEKGSNTSLIVEELEYFMSPNNKFFIFPCTSNNNILGYFIIENNHHFSEKEIILAKQYSNFLTIKLMGDVINNNEEVNSRRHIINKIFFDSSIPKEKVKEYLNILGTKPKDLYYIIVIKNEPQTNSIENHVQKKKIIDFFKSLTNQGFLVEDLYEDIVIILFFNEGELFSINIEKILNNLYKYLISNVRTIKIGYSQKNNNLEELPSSLEEAKEAILIGSSFYPNENVYCFNQFIQIKLFSKLLNTKEYAIMRKKIIEPLELYNSSSKLELIKTLEVCLNSDTLHKAANELYIHINSLRYRLDKIKNLTGEDFSTNSGRQILNNSVMLYNLEKLYNKDKNKSFFTE